MSTTQQIHSESTTSTSSSSTCRINIAASEPLWSYQHSLSLLSEHPFPFNPYLTENLESAIRHLEDVCDRCFSKKKESVCPQYPPLAGNHDLKTDQQLVHVICQDLTLMHPCCQYTKDFFTDALSSSSYASKELLSSFNLVYYPAQTKTRSEQLIAENLGHIRNELSSTTFAIVAKMDDQHFVHTIPIPGSAHSLKFSKLIAIASIASKTLSSLALLTDLGDVNRILIYGSLNWIDEIGITSSANALYMEIWYLFVSVKKLYSFSISTIGGSLKNFTVVATFENRMKSRSEIEDVMGKFIDFYVDYLQRWTLPLVGDAYVWMNSLKVLWCNENPRFISRRLSILPWPDVMHIALNLQEAVIKFGYSILLPIWSAAYPDAPFDPFNLRPKRRVGIITLFVVSWQQVRASVLSKFRAVNTNDVNGTRILFLNTIIWFFEEVLPLSLDVNSILINANLDEYRTILRRLLPLFIMFHKRNYVTITTYLLGILEFIPKELKNYVEELLRIFSIEDLEVFTGILKTVVRHHDSADQISRKSLMLTASLCSAQEAISEF
ncbi:hypothetical protein HK098_006480, partial [Nowakowskiella sp. JEL0407]